MDEREEGLWKSAGGSSIQCRRSGKQSNGAQRAGQQRQGEVHTQQVLASCTTEIIDEETVGREMTSSEKSHSCWIMVGRAHTHTHARSLVQLPTSLITSNVESVKAGLFVNNRSRIKEIKEKENFQRRVCLTGRREKEMTGKGNEGESRELRRDVGVKGGN